MSHSSTICVLALFVSGCAVEKRFDSPQPASQGGAALKTRLRQLDVASGSTNVKAADGIPYEIVGVQDAVFASNLAGQVEAHSDFWDQAGNRVPATATVVPPIRISTDSKFVIVLRPATPLANDAWHTLRFSASPDFTVGSFDNVRPSADVVFFTGSAPRLRYVSRTKAPASNCEFLEVKLSEPVALANLATNGLSLTSDSGSPLAGCVFWGTDCLPASSSLSMSGFLFKLSAPLQTEPGLSKVTLANQLAGATRTVGAAKLLAAAPLGGTSTPTGVEYSMNDADWFPCNGDSSTLCWTAPLPLQ